MSLPKYKRAQHKTLTERLNEPRRFMQVVAGPRQVGKTTLVRQAVEPWGERARYASADEPGMRDRAWIAAQWEAARAVARESDGGAILALDEIHKTPQWSETVKRLWDEDTRSDVPLRVILSGSAPLLLNRGLTESLAGRFEVIRLGHWPFAEMRSVFGVTIDEFIYFGGYPGAAPLQDDSERWTRYIRDALVETTIARDVLLMTRVDKPALLRQLFDLGSRYSTQILSYNKMLGQLQDAGNTTTLAHYLDLLEAAGMVRGLQKFSGSEVRSRGSSPKLQVLNNALMTVAHPFSFVEARGDPVHWGRLTESAVGAYLARSEAVGGRLGVTYWRHRSREVDFVFSDGKTVVAVEVKSAGHSRARRGLEAFVAAHPDAKTLLVGGDGIPVEEFLQRNVADWLRS